MLESINKALEEGNYKTAFQLLQNKDANLPFLYSDHFDKYVTALKRERWTGVPRNVMVSYCSRGYMYVTMETASFVLVEHLYLHVYEHVIMCSIAMATK